MLTHLNTIVIHLIHMGLRGRLGGRLKGGLGGGLKRGLKLKSGPGKVWLSYKQDFRRGLVVQVRSRSGLVQVWFSIELKFNSFELDSEVGRLVLFIFLFPKIFVSSQNVSKYTYYYAPVFRNILGRGGVLGR